MPILYSAAVREYFGKPDMLNTPKILDILIIEQTLRLLHRVNLETFFSGRESGLFARRGCALINGNLCGHFCPDVTGMGSLHNCVIVWLRASGRFINDKSLVDAEVFFSRYLQLIKNIAGTGDLYAFAETSKEDVLCLAMKEIQCSQ